MVQTFALGQPYDDSSSMGSSTCSMEDDICDTGLTAVSLEDARQNAIKEHQARIGRAHLEAAQAATRAQVDREHRARAAGMTVEEYMMATNQWPSMHGMPSPEVRAALAARLTRF